MKRQVRQGVYETNSSSTHSICISQNAELTIPKSIHFEFGEFGWECDTLGSISEKASYLYTGLTANDRREDFSKIVSILELKGLEVTFKETKTDTYHNEGYVDHSDKLYDFLGGVCSDEDELMQFLFSPLSFIITGNDNDDTNVDVNVDYPHSSYYKGN